MNVKCINCGKCCLDVEMLLSEEDITLIVKNLNNLKREDFVIKNVDSYFQLKNFEGHCIFFDISSKSCKIYDFRPQGCRYYPLIYDCDKKICKLDIDCPRIHLFYQNNREFEKICEKLKYFLKNQLHLDV